MKPKIKLNANQSAALTSAQSRPKVKTETIVMLALLLFSALTARAQETSRQIPFTNLATTLPQKSTQSIAVQLQDRAGAVVFSETHPEVAVDSKGRISFVFGALAGEGLNPEHFPSGSSRFIDVLNDKGASVLDGGRVALTAAAFALSPGPAGPEGPQGPEGPRGPEGPAGTATVVSAGDGSISVGGTPSAPSLAVAPNGINNTKVADNALSPAKITGTAATLGANVFSANQSVNGELNVTGAINTGTQYNIGRTRVLGIDAAAFNTFAGLGTGLSNTTGKQNSFFGAFAGQKNTTGLENSFFGSNAGGDNTTGNKNSFFGNAAGSVNTTGSDNSFFGRAAGLSNKTGDQNSFFGSGAGFTNNGTNNSFFGKDAGFANTTGFDNAFFGSEAGRNNATGIDNSFFGRTAGFFNTTGEGNSFFGREAGFGNSTGSDNAFFGFAAGRNNQAGGNNSFFGRGAGQGNNEGNFNSFFGSFAGAFNVTGVKNAFFGSDAGRNNNAGSDNTFVGRDDGLSNTTESRNTFVGAAANGAAGVFNATAVGANAVVTQSNSVVLGSNAFVGVGTSAPKTKLHVQGGNIHVGSPGLGIILKSPNGAVCRLLSLSDAGALVVSAAACP